LADAARKVRHELGAQVAVVADVQAVPELEQIGAFQEKRPLSRKEQREAAEVYPALLDLSLGEVRVDGQYSFELRGEAVTIYLV
jgi:hypothetical protein